MKTILFFGDSLTAGYGLRSAHEESFPALIQKKLNEGGYLYRTINAGVSGDTTETGLMRLNNALTNTVDIFVLELGANDMIKGLDPHKSC